MRKIIMLILSMVIINTSYSQEWETLGSGVIDFLLTNPKTANRTNKTEEAALRVIGNVLDISAQRKHEMNVANANRSEIIFNTDSGNQATVYTDNNGNVYLLYNGKIYPISNDLVKQAKEETISISGSTLPRYNLSYLENEYRFEKTYSEKEYFLRNDQETLCEIASKYDIKVEDIYFRYLSNGSTLSYKSTIPQIKKLYNCKHSLKKEKSGKYKGYVTIPGVAIFGGKNSHFRIYFMLNDIYEHKIVTTFTCNWSRDFNSDGLDFDDFYGIKRSLTKGEHIQFVLGYTSGTNGEWKFEIIGANIGQTVYTETGEAKKGGRVVTVEKESNIFPEGVYIYNFTMTAPGQEKISKSEKFEISEVKKDF